MYGYGRGPMHGGFGPMGGPMPHRPMGFGPMNMRRRPMGFFPMGIFPMGIFPMGGLFLVPALLFGGWIVIAVAGGVLGLMGAVIGGLFSGLEALASGVFSGGGLVVGIVIGLAAYCLIHSRKAAGTETEE